VCCLAEGGKVVKAPRPYHGKKSLVYLFPSPLFRGLPPRIWVGRYHSLIVERESLPPSLEVIAQTESGEIMALQHISRLLFGVQFHPESVLTPQGKTILKNFLEVGLSC